MSDYGTPPPPPPPAPGYNQPTAGGTPPPNYLVWAILSTIFCCLPLGIASIVFAAQVNGKYASGDVAGAQDSSAKAKRFAIIAAVVGVVVNAIYFAVVLPNLNN
ncbi:Interferon-induced transmembrane protein [Pedococcus dokdonensis]|uniref:Interferon-induced transmembrane protein n=1 Tax=Pedococcus dokdonensis TaxID=443156 RepID=A0A1H0STD0_9MICO|nr:CD225/dispanin family protein [Pedococcus dokdonensis]SDP44865.1 Interferon-induced transmembrane protein [Pedococcus dokdonensis]